MGVNTTESLVTREGKRLPACVMTTTLALSALSERQPADCVDEAPSRCTAIDAVLDQAYLHDILQHVRSAFKLAIYGVPVHLVLAAVAAVAFWSGASRHALASPAHHPDRTLTRYFLANTSHVNSFDGLSSVIQQLFNRGSSVCSRACSIPMCSVAGMAPVS